MLKWLVLSATLLIGLIVVVQLYWLSKVYSLEQRQFNNNVVKSLRGVFEDLSMNDNPTQSLQQLIHNPAQNYYIFKADTIPEQDSLTHYIRKEFSDFDVLTDVKLRLTAALLKNMFMRNISPQLPPDFI
jgi:two-component system phosphate regulon sensor histidine kinase PhoR